jgi:hypothetical protein
MRNTAMRFALVLGMLSAALINQVQAKKYAILIGVETYDPTQLSALGYAEDDVLALAESLKVHGFDVVVMTSSSRIPSLKPVNAGDILSQLDRRLRDRATDDTMIVALSGHGVQLKSDPADSKGAKETYFCPERADLGNRKSLIPISLVMQKLTACKAGRKLLIVDACRNEVEPKGVKDKAAEIELDPAGVARRDVPKGMLTLFSCTAKERSYEFPALKHSVFIHHLLEYLNGDAEAVRYPKGQLSVTELASYASRSTRDFVDTRLSKDQRPELVSPGGLTDWSLGTIAGIAGTGSGKSGPDGESERYEAGDGMVVVGASWFGKLTIPGDGIYDLHLCFTKVEGDEVEGLIYMPTFVDEGQTKVKWWEGRIEFRGLFTGKRLELKGFKTLGNSLFNYPVIPVEIDATLTQGKLVGTYDFDTSKENQKGRFTLNSLPPVEALPLPEFDTNTKWTGVLDQQDGDRITLSLLVVQRIGNTVAGFINYDTIAAGNAAPERFDGQLQFMGITQKSSSKTLLRLTCFRQIRRPRSGSVLIPFIYSGRWKNGKVVGDAGASQVKMIDYFTLKPFGQQAR